MTGQLWPTMRWSFKTGCFGIDLVAQASSPIAQAIEMFSGSGVSAALNVVALLGLIGGAGHSLLALVRWAKKRLITKTVAVSTDRVRIYIDDDHMDVETKVLELFRNYKIRKALEDIVYKPLSRDGIDSFAIVETGKGDDSPSFYVHKGEADSFMAPSSSDEEINRHVAIVSLQVLSPNFAEGNKWRFSDGSNSFFANVEDAEFIRRVQSSQEAFAKDDILKVELLLTQWLTTKGMRTDYTVLRVVGHMSGAKQADIFNAG